MTKHLRFLIVLLMTLVWSTGGAQTTIWSEDWTGGKNTQTPSAFKPAIYTQSSNVSIQTGSPSAGGNAPELMIKSNSYWTVKITDLKGCKGDVTLTLKTNQIDRLSVSVGSTAINLSAVEGQTKTFSGTFNVNDLAVPFNIVFKNKHASKNLRIDDIILIGTSVEESKTATNVSFGDNTGLTFTFTEGEYADGTFTAPTATETKGVEGTIVYSSDNESAVKVNPSTGALSFPGYGEATITATFTPTDAETYAVSTDSYKVKNERGVVAGTITFDKANGAFENVDGIGYNNKDYQFVSDSNESFTFKCTNVTKQNECLQLQGGGGKVESPTFPQFTNGYKVYVVYSSKTALTLKAGEYEATGTTTTSVTNDGAGADVSIEVPANESFVINAGSGYAKISKIEIIPNKIDETETITLNEAATNNTIEAKTGVNVTLKRTMKAGVWNTICLPFEVSEDKAKTAFGDGMKIAALDAKSSTGTTLKFDDYTTLGIPAATPCLIKPSDVKTSNEYVFENVKITAENVNPGFNKTDDGFVFVGIYDKADITDNIKTRFPSCYAAFLGANNTVYKANPVTVPGKETKGFRAYFAIPNSVKASELRVVIDGTTTSIKSIDSEVVESNAPVYNLQGQRVDGNNLTPGIYVKAGKKFVVK